MKYETRNLGLEFREVPSSAFQQELLVATEERGEYF